MRPKPQVEKYFMGLAPGTWIVLIGLVIQALFSYSNNITTLSRTTSDLTELKGQLKELGTKLDKNSSEVTELKGTVGILNERVDSIRNAKQVK